MSARFILASHFEFFVRKTRTRFPFRYGIASMTDVPHQFLRVSIRQGQRSATGLAAEGLPPKWFTKNPGTDFESDLADMMQVILHATQQAERIGTQSLSFFEFSQRLAREQETWAAIHGHVPLLAGLGTSLCERAVLDALCRSLDRPLHAMIQDEALGIDLSSVHSELRGLRPGDLLPRQPTSTCHVRHTIGLGDPLTPCDLPENERLHDGLPQDLESCVKTYGLRYFKIKLSGQLDPDRQRLHAIQQVISSLSAEDWRATLDGNEQFKDMSAFRAFWEELKNTPALAPLWPRVLLVEQPVHRDHALTELTGESLRSWPNRPPMIIDESDGAIHDLPRALTLGYAGTSHKNCKGIVKGLAHACLLARRRQTGQTGLITGEDLCNLGPVPLLQDFAMMSVLGMTHVERNGHHYFRGLDMWPPDQQELVLKDHSDLYHRLPEGFAALRIRNGQVQLNSVNHAPFGLRPLLDPLQMGATPNLSAPPTPGIQRP